MDDVPPSDVGISRVQPKWHWYRFKDSLMETFNRFSGMRACLLPFRNQHQYFDDSVALMILLSMCCTERSDVKSEQNETAAVV